MHLVGDIGGTKSLLALAAADGSLHAVARLRNDDYASFDELLGNYLRQHDVHPVGGCLAVAGPIADDGRHAQLTNRHWSIDLSALEATFDWDGLQLVNDFAAAAMGSTVATETPPLTLQTGQVRSDANRLVIGAGTGLGVATLIPAHNGWHVLPGEGGHIGFAPQDEQQDALCRWLRARHSRVIIEHVVSGSGLAAIHTFLGGAPLSPEAIAAAARSGNSLARAAFDLFSSIYGAVAGDYALATLARGGVYLAGGIAAANTDLLQSSPFLQAFGAKGVHATLAASMPIHIVREPLLGLHGAAMLANTPIAHSAD